jgi:hypothetical protein
MWLNGKDDGAIVGGSYRRLFSLGVGQTAGAIDVYSTGSTTYVSISGGGITFSSSSILNSAYNHFAITRSGTSVRIFANGSQVASATDSTDLNSASSNTSFVGALNATAGNFLGYIADFRVLKGTALYTSSFTPPTAPLTAISNTQLLLNYTNAGVIDNAMMNNLETVGNAQISTTQSKWGGSSIAFDGTGDYLVGASNPQIAVGSGDFTIEMWIYLTANFDGTGQGLVTAAYNTNFAVIGVNGGAGNRIEFYVVNSVLTSGTNYISLTLGRT